MMNLIMGVVIGGALGVTLMCCLFMARDRAEQTEPKEPAKLFTVGSLVKWRGDTYEIKRLYVDAKNQTIAAIRDESFYFEDVPVEELEGVRE